MYFYELQEGDNDVFADLLLASDEEVEPEAFFRIVQEIRGRVIDSYTQDTLIEAIAEELERDHGFIFISDARLTAAVNVSRDPDENFLADLDAADDDEDRLDDDDGPSVDYRTIVADLQVPRPQRPH